MQRVASEGEEGIVSLRRQEEQEGMKEGEQEEGQDRRDLRRNGDRGRSHIGQCLLQGCREEGSEEAEDRSTEFEYFWIRYAVDQGREKATEGTAGTCFVLNCQYFMNGKLITSWLVRRSIYVA